MIWMYPEFCTVLVLCVFLIGTTILSFHLILSTGYSWLFLKPMPTFSSLICLYEYLNRKEALMLLPQPNYFNFGQRKLAHQRCAEILLINNMTLQCTLNNSHCVESWGLEWQHMRNICLNDLLYM